MAASCRSSRRETGARRQLRRAPPHEGANHGQIPADVAKAAFQAYVDDDRAAIEALIADDLVFTSPYDNGISRETYFALCWPNHERMAAVDIVRAIEADDEALLTYVGRMKNGRAIRNTEIFTIRDGRIHAVEVYFGWSIPHEAAPGTHREP